MKASRQVPQTSKRQGHVGVATETHTRNEHFRIGGVSPSSSLRNDHDPHHRPKATHRKRRRQRRRWPILRRRRGVPHGRRRPQRPPRRVLRLRRRRFLHLSLLRLPRGVERRGRVAVRRRRRRKRRPFAKGRAPSHDHVSAEPAPLRNPAVPRGDELRGVGMQRKCGFDLYGGALRFGGFLSFWQPPPEKLRIRRPVPHEARGRRRLGVDGVGLDVVRLGGAGLRSIVVGPSQRNNRESRWDQVFQEARKGPRRDEVPLQIPPLPQPRQEAAPGRRQGRLRAGRPIPRRRR
mmetsp:Transcript_40029/g.73955  ORF Transcript_40029/g.73955 Transcript_40029/m.73955 type:complete len:291 (+) Transcript_40029:2-874(+)